MMTNNDNRHINLLTEADIIHNVQDYVWATSEESRRHALSLCLIGSIVHKHRGTVQIDAETYSINIDVPDEEKIACAEALSKKVGMTLH